MESEICIFVFLLYLHKPNGKSLLGLNENVERTFQKRNLKISLTHLRIVLDVTLLIEQIEDLFRLELEM